MGDGHWRDGMPNGQWLHAVARNWPYAARHIERPLAEPHPRCFMPFHRAIPTSLGWLVSSSWFGLAQVVASSARCSYLPPHFSGGLTRFIDYALPKMIYLDDITAYRFWFSGMRACVDLDRAHRLDTPLDCPTSATELDSVHLDVLPRGLGMLSLAVADESQRIRRSKYKYHVMPPSLPAGSFVQLNEEICVASPELTLLQMSRHFSQAHLSRSICEACGSYVSMPGFDGKCIDDLLPITSREKLEAFADSRPEGFCVAPLRRALGWCSEHSASPRETELQLLLNMGTFYGGAHVPRFEMNVKLALPAPFQRYLGKRYVVPDLYDAAANLDVEYMSDQEHSGTERRNQDSKRRNVLEQMGVHVIEVWNEDMKNAVAFERIVEEVKRGLGIRYRMSSPAMLERRQRLMNELRADPLRAG